MANSPYLMPVKVSSLSTTFVKCRISSTENGVATDPTDGSIAFAFIPESDDNADPESGDWNAGVWETAPDGYWAKSLVGPEGIALAVGSYDVWVRLIKAPETVVNHVGVLSIY